MLLTKDILSLDELKNEYVGFLGRFKLNFGSRIQGKNVYDGLLETLLRDDNRTSYFEFPSHPVPNGTSLV